MATAAQLGGDDRVGREQAAAVRVDSGIEEVDRLLVVGIAAGHALAVDEDCGIVAVRISPEAEEGVARRDHRLVRGPAAGEGAMALRERHRHVANVADGIARPVARCLGGQYRGGDGQSVGNAILPGNAGQLREGADDGGVGIVARDGLREGAGRRTL